MAQYIKLNNEWKEILDVYKKINGKWALQTDIQSSILQSNIYFYSEVRINDEVTCVISGVNEYTGKSFNLTYIYNNRIVAPTWSIISGDQYATINEHGKVEIDVGVTNETIIVQAVYIGHTITKTIVISYDNQLIIEGADTITGASGNVICRFNNTVVNPEWAIVNGNNFATIDNRGNITIISSGTIEIEAEYVRNNNTYTAIKQIALVYDAETTTETTIDENGTITTETTSTTTDQESGSTTTTTTTITTDENGYSQTTSTEITKNTDGSTSSTTTTTDSTGTTTETTSNTSAPDHETGAITTKETTTTTNADGTSSETSSTTVENQDGSSQTSSETINYDENGDATGSTTNEVTNNADGSSSSSTTNYDNEGNPTDQVNQTQDTSGNTSTQTVEYNDNGDPVVTGYDIDTSGSENGNVNFDGTGGVNTNYYAFDMTHGFEMALHFTIDFTQQPPNQSDNHHNVMAMKRQDSQPWYGFQIRYAESAPRTIQLGTQFSTGSNTNQTITASSANYVNGYNNVHEYNIKIVYDPTLSSNQFVCDELIGGYHKSYTGTFPDLAELKYIKVTVGCALDGNGDPYRFCNMDVFEFYIKKLHNIDDPVITCTNGQTITVTCATQGASIYYKLNNTGDYVLYTGPISIHEDTTIQAYSQLEAEKSDIITRSYVYDNGIEEPEIDTVNNEIILTCETQGATIYYRLNQYGSYIVYTEPISIEEDTIIQTYAQVGNEHTQIISATCLYDNGIETPIISCNGETVTIGCNQANAEIYYRLNQSGEFIQYDSAIEILADTIVEAYVKVGNQIGHTAIENCIYDPILLDPPIIISNGPSVVINCPTTNATIFYKLNNTGSFTQYSGSITILDDTYVQAYSMLRGKQSQVVSETCIYSDVHDYSMDYLTFQILENGVIPWKQNTVSKTIEYSLNAGPWTSITSTSNGVMINVSQGDTIRFRGNNNVYCNGNKSQYSGFGLGESGTNGDYVSNAASFNVEGNVMSLIYGDNFINQTSFPSGTTYNLCSLFKKAKVVSAENLILPVTTLTEACYRAMFSWATYLTKAPVLPALILAKFCYWYMFESTAITTAPDLLAEILVNSCYGSMFTGCASLNFIKCMANAGFNQTNCLQTWTNGVASSGTFVKDSGTAIQSGKWTRGTSGIPTNWLVYDDVPVAPPTITYDGFSTITLACETQGATIYYKLTGDTDFTAYSTTITITGDTVVQAYSELNSVESRVIKQTCVYVSDVPIEASNRDLNKWQYGGQEVTVPYSVNGVDGHSASYSKGTFTFETNFALRQAQPTYLWFQHADQSATIYIDDVQVTKHWGGYTAFTVDISNYVHAGQNAVKVQLKNNEGNSLAPANADFNFNATLGKVKLFTSPCLPGTQYGYDGFHVYSTVTAASATLNIKTTVPIGASVTCLISDGTYSWSDTIVSDGTEMTFTNIITNPRLWNGKTDPHLYNITLEISKDNVLYHRFIRPYGLRFYDYVINDTTILANEDPYTGFLLNGQPYLLRGCCMHDDIDGKANALDDTDYNNTFATIQELNLNFLRLAHYPHPKEVYDRCDQLGIIVQTEGPCVNKMQSTMPADYFTHLETQYQDMIEQHMNHPCIIFWGLSNETTTDDKDFAKGKINEYVSIIKNVLPTAWVGYVMAQSAADPSAYYNNPNCDWFGCNIYVGWYASPNSNNPSSEINKRITNIITNKSKMLAYSEYGCGGTQSCHSDEPLTTTTRGNNARHDIEYMMWLHEGQIAAIKNYPELVFTSQWQLFDIAVSNRNEGYTVCLDGETVTTNDELRRLNNKGLVERDHVTKKDTFYLYKAWWNPTKFIHICGKNYTKLVNRVIKCYTNETGSISLKVNGTTIETKTPSNNIVEFTAYTFTTGDVIVVEGSTSDTLTF